MPGKEQESQTRHLRIGIIGPIGSGKSTLADVLGARWGVTPIHENFQENPHLDDFYNSENPPFLASQLWFLQAKISSLRKHRGEQLEIWDPALEMDFLYSRTLHLMGALSDAEYETYQGIAEALAFERKIFEPDLFIVVNAPTQILIERINQRAREIEKAIDPNYVRVLSETVSQWIIEEKGRKQIFEINSDYYNFAEPGEHQKELIARIESTLAAMHLSSPQGKDGANLIFPSFFSTPGRTVTNDIPPGLPPEQKVLR